MKKIIIRGAKEHNLKSIDLEIPRDKLVVITGLSAFSIGIGLNIFNKKIVACNLRT